MKVLFLHKGEKKLGSNRIYIENLSRWLKPLIKKVTVSKSLKTGYDFYICSKFCTIKDLEEIKSKNKNSKIGLIHPSNNNNNEIKKLKIADFFIVGSIEEKVYLESYKNDIVRFPQIENYPLNLKKHVFKETFEFEVLQVTLRLKGSQILISWVSNFRRLKIRTLRRQARPRARK